MPKDDENVCCGENSCRSDEFNEYLEEQTLTQPNLKEWEGQFLQQETENARSIYDKLSENGKRRRLCYWKASFYFHERGWYPQDSEDVKYVALPSCIVWLIRRRFEEKEKGAYTGFPPKLELLRDVVKARETFATSMKQYGTAINVADPDGGLLTTLQLQLESNEQKVFDELLRASGVTDDKAGGLKQQWTDSSKECIETLPRLGLVACATSFEAFVHDMFKRCFETMFSTRTVNESDETYWHSWLNRRRLESLAWSHEEHQRETGFWEAFKPTKDIQCIKRREKAADRTTKHWLRYVQTLC